MYKYHATGLVARTFDERSIKYHVIELATCEEVQAAFRIDAGPAVVVKFISRDDGNDVAARIFGLVCGVPEDRRGRVLAACNCFNRKKRYMKLYLDEEGDVNLEYDFPISLPDESVGSTAWEIAMRMMQLMDDPVDGYQFLAKALYTNQPLEADSQITNVGLDDRFLHMLHTFKDRSGFDTDSVDEDDPSALELDDGTPDSK